MVHENIVYMEFLSVTIFFVHHYYFDEHGKDKQVKII